MVTRLAKSHLVGATQGFSELPQVTSPLIWTVCGVWPATWSSTTSALKCTPVELTVVTPTPVAVKCWSVVAPLGMSRRLIAGMPFCVPPNMSTSSGVLPAIVSPMLSAPTLGVQFTRIGLMPPLSVPGAVLPARVTVDDPGCWLLHETLPWIEDTVPSDPGGDPDAVSVSVLLICAPCAASNPVMPDPVKLRATNC